MRVVIAPDSFKGSLPAAAAAAALAAGWQAARPGDEVRTVPLADGGEGTLDVLAAAVPAARWEQAQVTGPAGQPVDCPWLVLPDGTAVVELAAASGLPLLSRPDPLGAHTIGLGEVIGCALDAGARHLTVALGGSASTDGGTGALAALGARFTGTDGRQLPPGGGALPRLAAVDLTGLRPPPPGGVSCLSDVRAPLLGPAGAAAVFGPQKGARPDQVALLDSGLARLAGLLGGDPAAPGAGAAGGTGYGLAAAWGALIGPGAPQLAGWPAWTRRWPGPGWSSPARAGTTRRPAPARWPGRCSPPRSRPACRRRWWPARWPPARRPACPCCPWPGWPAGAGGARRPGPVPAAGRAAAGRRVGRSGIAPINLGGCGRSRCSAAAPTLNWRPRSAPTWANGCARCG